MTRIAARLLAASAACALVVALGAAMFTDDRAAGQTPTPTPTPTPMSTPAPVPAVAPAAGPIVVRTAVYVLNVGRLDTQSGEFTIDF